MKAKISKAQVEVWEWKEKAADGIANIPENKIATTIKNRTKEAREFIKKRRQQKNKSAILK
jgi:hypothetical protein